MYKRMMTVCYVHICKIRLLNMASCKFKSGFQCEKGLTKGTDRVEMTNDRSLKLLTTSNHECLIFSGFGFDRVYNANCLTELY